MVKWYKRKDLPMSEYNHPFVKDEPQATIKKYEAWYSTHVKAWHGPKQTALMCMAYAFDSWDKPELAQFLRAQAAFVKWWPAALLGAFAAGVLTALSVFVWIAG